MKSEGCNSYSTVFQVCVREYVCECLCACVYNYNAYWNVLYHRCWTKFLDRLSNTSAYQQKAANKCTYTLYLLLSKYNSLFHLSLQTPVTTSSVFLHMPLWCLALQNLTCKVASKRNWLTSSDPPEFWVKSMLHKWKSMWAGGHALLKTGRNFQKHSLGRLYLKLF